MNPYELRYKIISDAANMLMVQHSQEIDSERMRADRAEEAPKIIPLPDFKEIESLAQKFYEFVNTK